MPKLSGVLPPAPAMPLFPPPPKACIGVIHFPPYITIPPIGLVPLLNLHWLCCLHRFCSLLSMHCLWSLCCMLWGLWCSALCSLPCRRCSLLCRSLWGLTGLWCSSLCGLGHSWSLSWWSHRLCCLFGFGHSWCSHSWWSHRLCCLWCLFLWLCLLLLWNSLCWPLLWLLVLNWLWQRPGSLLLYLWSWCHLRASF